MTTLRSLSTRLTTLPTTSTSTFNHRTFHSTQNHLISIKTRIRMIPLDPTERFKKEKRNNNNTDIATSTPLKRKLLKDISTRRFEKGGTTTSTDAMRWLYGEGLAYYDMMEKPRNFLKPDMPFPMNPAFKPVCPISNTSRNELFLEHNKDPVTNTPRKLAEKYGISIVRVQAIIRSKALELEMLQRGETVEQNFAKSMDFVLGAVDIPGTEKDIQIMPQVHTNIPFFAIAEEDVEFGPKEAAEALGRPSLGDMKETMYEKVDRDAVEFTNSVKIRSGESRLISHDEMVAAAPVVSGPDPTLKNIRHQYQFVDLSNQPGRKNGDYGRRSLMRDRAGVLREATPVERANHATVRNAKMDVYIGKWNDMHSRERELAVGGDGITYSIAQRDRRRRKL